MAIKSSLRRFHTTVDSSGLSIKLPINGAETYTVNRSSYHIDPGSFFVVNSGQQLTCTIDSQDVIESICIYLDNDLYSEIWHRHQFVQDLDLEISRINQQVIVDKYKIMDCALSYMLHDISKQQTISSLTEEDYIQLTEELALHQIGQRQMIKQINAVNHITKKEIVRRLRIAQAYIFDNYDEPITLDDIAKASCLSKYYLLRTYKAVYKTTPYQALLNRRIQKSKELLIAGNRIHDVAIDCGFSDRRAFSRVFKNACGFPPSSYVATSIAS